jgi:murein DD-endopeptidase MepM/ murein hydrolase activator NlpD
LATPEPDGSGVPHDGSVLLSVIVVLASLLAFPATVQGAPDRWQQPIAGATVARTFSFDPAAPYVGGARRGIDLAASGGAPVVAACAGTVTYAGSVPAWGRGVSLRCGRLVATELGLGAVGVRRGAAVRAGSVLGRLGARGVLRLGARRAGARHGYVDPLTLLAGADAPPAPVSVPPAVAPRASAPRPLQPAPRTPRIAPRALPAAPADRRVPWLAWAGLGLLAAGGGGAGVACRRRRGRPGTGIALAPR